MATSDSTPIYTTLTDVTDVIGERTGGAGPMGRLRDIKLE